MAQELIKCPECGVEFELSKAISTEIEGAVSKKYEKQMQNLKEKAKKDLETKEQQLLADFKSEQNKIEEKARKRAEEILGIELLDIKAQLGEKTKKLEESRQRELNLLQKERALQEKENALELESSRKIAKIEKEVRESAALERKQLEEKVRKQVEETYQLEVQDLKGQLDEKSAKLETSQKQELEFRKKQRELENREKALELEVIRRADAERNKILEETTKQLEEKHRLKDAEKEKQLSDMKRKIDELQRKADQSSQQAQGEILELDLESRLRTKFLLDDIEPIQKGIKGADVLQIIKTQLGRCCGKILWESKRTKSWSDSWIQKAKDDQLVSKADIVVIMSEVLPKGVLQFEQINGVWVTDIACAINLALVLRGGLIQVTNEKELQAGRQSNKEVVYNYVTGLEFKNRVEAILGSFVNIKTGLAMERRAMEKIWAKHEKNLERVIQNIAGMRGDLEGIAGKALPVIKMLELSADEVPSEEEIVQN